MTGVSSRSLPSLAPIDLPSSSTSTSVLASHPSAPLSSRRQQGLHGSTRKIVLIGRMIWIVEQTSGKVPFLFEGRTERGQRVSHLVFPSLILFASPTDTSTRYKDEMMYSREDDEKTGLSTRSVTCDIARKQREEGERRPPSANSRDSITSIQGWSSEP